MNKPDDLEQLWKTQPVDTTIKGEEMHFIVLKKIAAFDRKIRVRNTTETFAAVLVAGFFLFAAWHRDGLERLGSAIVAAGALWIIYYIRRHGTSGADPSPDQPAEAFRLALTAKYEHQIRLLRSVKFWYLLPMYVGLLVSSAGHLLRQTQTRPLTPADALPALLYTLVFALVWWLNEVYAVRKLQRQRAEITGELSQ